MVDTTQNITDEWSEKISEVEKTKDLFGLNNQLKTEDKVKEKLKEFDLDFSDYVMKQRTDTFKKAFRLKC